MVFEYLRLKILLESRDMTVLDLANALEVSEQLVYRWIHGKSVPGIEVYIRLCQFFNVDMNFFYPEMRSKKPETVLA